MKILQLTKKFPYPPKDGESIAILNLAKAMKALDCDVSLLSMNTKKHFVELESLPASFDYYAAIKTVPIDNELKVKDAFVNLFSNSSYHINRFISEAYREKLKLILQANSFDFIQLETLYLAPYIPTIRKYSKAKVAMRAHNVEHEIWERIAYNTSNPVKKWYLQLLSQKLKKFEVDQFNNYDLLVPITQRDLRKFQKLGFKGQSHITPIGIDSNDYKPNYTVLEKELAISFIGSLDWMPNQEGVQWFLKHVWPSVIKKYPNLKFHIAGRNPPQWIKAMATDNVIIHGEVPNAPTFVNQYPLTIVPLLSGSGMRVKILEGMALGKVVLTTSVGLEGIHAKDKKEVLIANSAKAFYETIEYCFQNKERLVQIGKQARSFVTRAYDNLEIGKALLDKYRLALK